MSSEELNKVIKLAQDCNIHKLQGSYTVAELKDFCTRLGLQVGGNKYKLVERLLACYCPDYPIYSLNESGRPTSYVLKGKSCLAKKLSEVFPHRVIKNTGTIITSNNHYFQDNITIFGDEDMKENILNSYKKWSTVGSGTLSMNIIRGPDSKSIRITKIVDNGKTYMTTFYNFPYRIS
jgi:hypothetical protein